METKRTLSIPAKVVSDKTIPYSKTSFSLWSATPLYIKKEVNLSAIFWNIFSPHSIITETNGQDFSCPFSVVFCPLLVVKHYINSKNILVVLGFDYSTIFLYYRIDYLETIAMKMSFCFCCKQLPVWCLYR